MGAFDPSTATPFDPSTAQPVGAFDPSTATEFDPTSAVEVDDTPKRQVGAFESLVRGAKEAAYDTSANVNKLLGAGPVLYDAAKSAVTGTSTTDAQDAYFRSLVDPAEAGRHAEAINPDTESQSFGAKVAGMGGRLAVDLPLMVATGGENAIGEAVGPVARLAQTAAHAAKATLIPGARHAADDAQDVLASGGTGLQAAGAGASTFATDVALNAAPIGVSGTLGQRLGSGAIVGGATSEAARQSHNVFADDKHQQPFDLENLALGTVQGAAMSGVLGGRPGPDQLNIDAARLAQEVENYKRDNPAPEAMGGFDPSSAEEVRPDSTEIVPTREPQAFDPASAQEVDAPLAAQPEAPPVVDAPVEAPIAPAPQPAAEVAPVVEMPEPAVGQAPASVPDTPALEPELAQAADEALQPPEPIAEQAPAPIASAEQAVAPAAEEPPAREPITPIARGASGEAFTSNNDPIPFTYAVVDNASLTASNHDDGRINPAYPAEMQPRDRTSPESRMQVSRIGADLNPTRLGDAADIVNGAPLVGADGVVESGNGRVMAIRSAPLGKRLEYKEWLARNADKFGLDPESIRNAPNPVLVRVRDGDLSMADRAELGREGNRGTQLSMNPTELARSDSRVIDDDLMSRFNPSEDGDVLAASNQDFLRAFAREIGANESAGLASEGRWTKQMADRVKAAVFHRAYGDDRLLESFASEADPENKNMLSALSIGAREFALARSEGADAAGMNAGPLFAEALGVIRDAKQRGQSVDSFLGQGDMLSGGPSPDVARVARWMQSNARSPRQLGSAILELGRGVRAELANRTSGDMFGRRDTSLSEIVDGAIRKSEQQNRPTSQSGLFTAGGKPRSNDERGDRQGEQQGAPDRAPVDAVPPADEPRPEEAVKPDPAQQEAPEAPAPGKGEDNTVFTRDAYEAARARLKAKMNRLNSGFDPEMLMDGITIAGFHIEAGARKFHDFAKAMIDDMGADITPYLKQLYSMAYHDPRSSMLRGEMTKPGDVDAATVEPPAEKAPVVERPSEAKPERDVSASAVRKLRKTDKQFKVAFNGTESWHEPHPESPVAANLMDGYLDAKEGLPLDQSKVSKPSADMRPHGFNPVDSYLSGYRSQKAGKHVIVRVLDADDAHFPTEPPNVQRKRNPVESDRGQDAPDGRMGPDDGDAGVADGQGDRREDRSDGEGGSAAAGGAGVREGGAATGGKGRAARVRKDAPGDSRGDSGSVDGEGSGGDRDAGANADAGAVGDVADPVAKHLTPPEKIAAQKAAESVPVKLGDIDNIRESLPFLLPGQQDDVAFTERRHAKPNGYGVLFTNGTGTGKTYTGLGVVKRFAKQGKTNILVIAPSDKIITDWIDSAKNLQLDVTKLDNINDAGKGIVATTYANFYQNAPLVSRKWDLIIGDESHRILENKNGKETQALATLRALTLHPDGALRRAEMLDPESFAELAELRRMVAPEKLREDPSLLTPERVKRMAELREKVDAARDQAYKDIRVEPEQKPRVVFLSATPFSSVETIVYGESYLFDYGPPPTKVGYNEPDARSKFFMQHFGYRMRYNKLTKPEAGVDSNIMQQQFNTFLKQQGVLSARRLDVDKDYDRKFVLVPDSLGTKLDEGIDFLSNGVRGQTNQYMPLWASLKEGFKFHQKVALLETIKARASIPYIKKQLALGRKVVVFHDRIEANGFHPFRFERAPGREVTIVENNVPRLAKWDDLVAQFEAERPDLVALDFAGLGTPIAQFTKAFGKDVAFFNGTVPKKQRQAAVEAFNTDGSDVNLILVNSEAGKEGISLHDTTGTHPRVLLNLGLPYRPVTAIQIEGRIYRVGQKSDAMYRYFNTGTTFERRVFAQTVAERTQETENLALGEEARGLSDAFTEAFINADYDEPSLADGKGGKEYDRGVASPLSQFDRAKTLYFGRQKKTSRNKSAEGADYFATPEPVGLKMVEWASIGRGEAALEPSAGHGAIARFFPALTKSKMVEPSPQLAPEATLSAPHVELIESKFEDLSTANKFDAVVMNPPFGSGGKLAMDHVSKAAQHLKPGGRIVALIPTGPAADKQFERFMHGGGERTPIDPLFEIPDIGKVYRGDKVRVKYRDELVTVTSEKGEQYFIGKSPGGFGTLLQKSWIEGVGSPGPRERIVDPAAALSLTADIRMPAVTFERAGTKVATRIVILDKPPEGMAAPPQVQRDLTGANTIAELFDRIENMDVPERQSAPEGSRDVAEADAQPAPLDAPASTPAEVPARPLAAPRFSKDSPVFNAHESSMDTRPMAKARKFLGAQYGEYNALAKANGGGYAKAHSAWVFDSPANRDKFLSIANEKFGGEIKASRTSEPAPAPGEHLSVAEVNAIADDFIASYNGNLPLRIVVRDTLKDLYGDRSDELGNATGGYSSRTGTVGVPAVRMRNRAAVEETLRHEVVGHFGMDTLDAKDRRAVYDRILTTRKDPAFADLWEHVEKEYGEKSDDVQAEEVFAFAAEHDRGTLGRVWDQILTMLNTALRKVGLVKSILTRAELHDLARRISASIRRGEAEKRSEFDGDTVREQRPAESKSPADAVRRVVEAVGDTRRAYAKVANEVIDRVANSRVGTWYSPLGNLPHKALYLSKRYRALGKIAQVDDIARGVFDAFNGASAGDQKAIYEYMTTRGATPDAIVDAGVRARAAEVKKMIRDIGQELVDRGIIPEESMLEHDDEYLPRLYLKHLLDGNKGYTSSGKKTSTMGYAKKRKDIPEEIRKAILGEIEHAGFLASTAIGRTGRDTAILDFLEDVSATEPWVWQKSIVKWRGKRVTVQWLEAERQRLQRQLRYLTDDKVRADSQAFIDEISEAIDPIVDSMETPPDDFQQIPDSTRYGSLRGMYVHHSIHEDVVGIAGTTTPNPGIIENLFGGGPGTVGTKAVRWFKTVKVTLNIPTQIRNLVSNAMLLQLSGVPFRRMGPVLKRAVDEMIASNNGDVANSPHMEVAKRYGITSGTFSSIELVRMRTELLEVLAGQEESQFGIHHAKLFASKIINGAGDIYQGAETMFKLAKIIDAMKNENVGETEAALSAHKWLIDYSLVPRGIAWARSSPVGVPFATFMYGVIPRLAEAAVRTPGKFAPYIAMPYLAAAAFAALQGVTMDEYDKLKQAMPKWIKDKSHAFILPWKDANGQWQVMDMSPMLPWGGLADIASNVADGDIRDAISQSGLFGAPVSQLMTAALTGIDPFTGRPISNEGDPPETKAAAMLAYLWHMATPTWITDQGAAGKLYEATTGKLDRFTGKAKITVPQAIGRLGGINTYSVDPDSSRSGNIASYNIQIKQVQDQLRRRLRDPNLSDSDRQDLAHRYMDRVQDLADKRDQYDAGAQFPAKLSTAQ